MTLQEKVALVTRPRKRAPLAGGGADGNERLTAATAPSCFCCLSSRS